MKLIPVFVGVTMLLASCASGPSAHYVVGSQLTSPNVTFSEINRSLKSNGNMRMQVKKKIGQYSLVEFANWEMVFEGENLVFADKLSNGKDAESWMSSQINNHVQAKPQDEKTGKRIIIIE